MVLLSNNDRFDNDKIFLCNIQHFFIITRINYVSIVFVFILKIHERNLLQIYEQYVMVIARCIVQYDIKLCVANITDILNKRDCASQTIKEIVHREQQECFKQKRMCVICIVMDGSYMDTVKNVASSADIWKNTQIYFFKQNQMY